MISFADRRKLVPFCWLLAGAVFFAVAAKLLHGRIHFLPAASFVASLMFFWLAAIRELNAAACYLPQRMQSIIHWIHAQTMELLVLLGLIFLPLKTVFRRKQNRSA